MNTIKQNLPFVLGAALLTASMSAQAEHVFTLFDYPGASSTSLFGVNDRGDIVGTASISPNVFPFVLDLKTGAITNIAPVPGNFNTLAIGINNVSEIVGGLVNRDDSTEVAFVRSAGGAFTFFSHPEAVFFTEARGINETGQVTGYRGSADGTVGFVYDSSDGSFADFAPSLVTLPHGINNHGEVVGSALFFPEADPCLGAPAGAPIFQYGLMRSRNGAITYFQVNGQRTRGRAINEAGLIVGDVFDPSTGRTKGFTARLQGLPCESLTIAAGDLLEIADYGLIPEGITNSGTIVGIATNPASHGFIATRH